MVVTPMMSRRSPGPPRGHRPLVIDGESGHRSTGFPFSDPGLLFCVFLCQNLRLPFTIGIPGLFEDPKEMLALEAKIISCVNFPGTDKLTVLTTFPDLSTTAIVSRRAAMADIGYEPCTSRHDEQT